MGRKHDPLDDFEVVPHNPTTEEDQMMREFIKKDKEKRAKALAKKQAGNKTRLTPDSKKGKIQAA